MAKLKITVNKARCVGSGDCVETAPGVFQLDSEEKSEAYNPAGAADNVIVSAARSPSEAIARFLESARRCSEENSWLRSPADMAETTSR